MDGLTALHHGMCFSSFTNLGRFGLICEAVSEGHGDAALFLIVEGADTTKKDLDGQLAMDTAPDLKVKEFILDGIKRSESKDPAEAEIE